MGQRHKFCANCGASLAPLEGNLRVIPITDRRDVSDALRSFVAGRIGARLGEVDSRLATERRLVTAMFADVSGFTRLADQLDPEQLLEVIDPVVTRLANVVAPFEGYVEKFAGDALLALFGAPVTHEDDAERAVLVALEMQREIGRIREDLPRAKDLTLHIGINTGHGIARMLRSEVRTDYAVLGDSVILAQRLESAAPAGETYVSDSTYQATRHRFAFEDVGELALKGKTETVRAWKLLRERAATEQLAPRGRIATKRFVGREREMAGLRGVFDELVAGSGAFVALTGEPGIGKSRVTAEVRAYAEARGVRWLEGRCLSYGGGIPYWPYTDLLRRFAGISPEHTPSEAASRLVATLGPLGVPQETPLFARLLGVPATTSEVAQLEPEAFRRRLHGAFRALVTLLAGGSPICVAIEDAHWADSSSLALTAELSRVTAAHRFVLYLNGRPEIETALGGGADAVAARSFHLGPLDAVATSAVIEDVLGGRPPTRLVPLVVERTAGNPFFIEELTSSLKETGAVYLEEGAWILRQRWDAARLPMTLESVLASRIDLLPLATAQVLEHSSVIGRHVRLALLRAITPDPANLEAHVRELTDRGFFDPVDDEATATIHHALMQDIAYSRLLRKDRRDIHRRVADAAERLYGSGDDVIDLLARHLYLGEAGAKAIDYLLRAGKRAERLYANDEAIDHLGHAVEIARKENALADRLPAVILELAELEELVGDYPRAFELYAEARAAGSDVRAWRGMGSTLRRQGRFAEALQILRQAIEGDALSGQDLLPLRLEEAWNLNGSGRQDEAVATLRSALAEALLRRDATVGQLLLQLARRESEVGDLTPALEHALEARAIFDEQQEAKGLATATRVVGGAQYRLGRLDEAADTLRRSLQLAERVGSVEEIGASLINLGMVELRRGNLDEAIAADRRAIEEFERIGHQTGRTNAYANLAEKLMHRGEHDEALRLADKAIELARTIGYSLWLGDATQTRAAIMLRQGRYRDAAAVAEDAAAVYERIRATPRAASALALAAEAWTKAGDERRARDSGSRARAMAAVA